MEAKFFYAIKHHRMIETKYTLLVLPDPIDIENIRDNITLFGPFCNKNDAIQFVNDSNKALGFSS